MKILIADDHSMVRKGIRQILQDEFPSSEYFEASNASEVIRFVSENNFSIIILDITMPGRSGIEILKDIKKMKHNIPVLIVSMYPEDQFAVRSIKAGAVGYLTKESAPDELIKAVKTIFNGKKYITESIAINLLNELDSSQTNEPHKKLSNREYQVFIMISSGKTVSQIAKELSLSVKTISANRHHILQKMNMKTNAELTNYAFKNNLIL